VKRKRFRIDLRWRTNGSLTCAQNVVIVTRLGFAGVTEEGAMNRTPSRLALAALVSLCALIFVAASDATPSVETVVLSGRVESPQATVSLENVIAAFEATHPTIHVDYEPSSNYVQDTESSFAAGNPPDVFYVNSDLAPDWIARGYMLPLRGFAQKSGFDTSHFFSLLLHGFEGPGGQPYGFPKDWSPLAMYTNDALLAQAGVSAPATWSELRAAAEQIRAMARVTPICLSADWARLLAFVEENGGSLLNDARTAATIDSPAAKAAVEFYVRLVQDGLVALPSDLGEGWCGQAIADGVVAIAFEGNWAAAGDHGRPAADPVLDSSDAGEHSAWESRVHCRVRDRIVVSAQAGCLATAVVSHWSRRNAALGRRRCSASFPRRRHAIARDVGLHRRGAGLNALAVRDRLRRRHLTRQRRA
jgi:hypothetical protein